MDRRIYDNYVLQLEAHRSFTKAAAALNVSQPALSSGLSSLEKELGFKIFDRKSIPICLTPEGKMYHDYITKIQVLSDDLKRRIADYHKDLHSSVTIGGPVAYVESIVTDAVIWLRQQDPDCRINIKCAPLAELMDMASKGAVDCFISTSSNIPECFEKLLIKSEKVYLCIPQSNPINQLLAPHRVTPGEKGTAFDYSLLNGESFVFLENDQPLQVQITSFLKHYKITPKHSVTVNQVSTAVNLAVKGEGICFASESALEGNLDLSNICTYALPEIISGRNIYIAYSKDLFMPASCKQLLQFFANYEG